MPTSDEHDEPFVVHDKRKIDPETGQPRTAEEAAPEGAAAEASVSDDEVLIGIEIAGLTADLQRLQAEYANYRKRVERDRAVSREQAIADVLGTLLPVLDDLQRAREHDEFVGAFKAVGESVEAVVARFGLESYGVVGEAFDPEVHEALMHTTAEDAGADAVTVVTMVMQVGYRYAGRVLRPARVGVEDRNPA